MSLFWLVLGITIVVSTLVFLVAFIGAEYEERRRRDWDMEGKDWPC